jgi:hypothetical protein
MKKKMMLRMMMKNKAVIFLCVLFCVVCFCDVSFAVDQLKIIAGEGIAITRSGAEVVVTNTQEGGNGEIYTAGTGLALNEKEFSNTDRGSVAVSAHESTYNHGEYLISESDPAFTAWDKDYADLINKPTATGISYSNTTYTTVAAALDTLLYVAPSISSFTNNVVTVEKGSTVSSTTLSWALNKTMTTASIDQSIGSVLGLTQYVYGTSYTTDRSFTLTVGDGTNTATSTTSVYFRNRRHWGTSASSTLSSAAILSLAANELSTSRTKSWSQNGNGQYIYYAYPALFGTASFTTNGLPNTDWTLSVVSHTNASGHTEDYNVYRTNSIQNGTNILIGVS